jgi:hypothetical protein
MPSKGANRRLDLVRRVFEKRRIDHDAREFLKLCWDYFTRAADWSQVLVSYSDGAKGILWRLDHERFEWLPASEAHRPMVCDTCRQVWWHSVDGVCSSYRCPGTVRFFDES